MFTITSRRNKNVFKNSFAGVLFRPITDITDYVKSIDCFYWNQFFFIPFHNMLLLYFYSTKVKCQSGSVTSICFILSFTSIMFHQLLPSLFLAMLCNGFSIQNILKFDKFIAITLLMIPNLFQFILWWICPLENWNK